MSTEILARLQFAFTTMFHYIFPPMSIGLALLLVIMESIWLKSGNELYKRLTHFWVKIFALNFGIGVATGIVLEFEFGTNWSTYSRYVGDIFGSALAAEGVFAFFLESGFLALLVFGWNRISPRMHLFSTCMVALGSTFSAVWIIVANSWMQTPAGYQIVGSGMSARAHITDFWAMVFNPSSVIRLTHTLTAAYITGAFLVMSVSAYYLLKNRHLEIAKAGMKLGLIVSTFACILQIWNGHTSVVEVAHMQPSKFAAMEGVARSDRPVDITILGTVDPKTGATSGVKLPGMGSFLLTGNPNSTVKGFDQIPPEDRPPVAPPFYLYHLMIMVGFTMVGLTLLASYMAWKNTLWKNRLVLTAIVYSVVLPHIATQAGWVSAEMGRQPWIVYGMLRTSDALSKVVTANQILFSLIMFTLLYMLLGYLFFYLLNKRIQEGPEDADWPEIAGSTIPVDGTVAEAR